MDAKQKRERRNQLGRERYANSEANREKYRAKARAWIPARNEKRKAVTRAKAEEVGIIVLGPGKRYIINSIIMEAYRDEARSIRQAERLLSYWQDNDARKVLNCIRAKNRWASMTIEQRRAETQRRARRTTEKQREYHTRYRTKLREENPEKLKRMLNGYAKKARAKPLNRAKANMSKRFRDALRKYRTTHKDSMSAMIGCTWAHFDAWITRQFKRGMTWANYGSLWHIDHIEPLASFDVRDRDDMRRAWHYTNLRPLTAEENMAKSDTIITHQPELVLCMP